MISIPARKRASKNIFSNAADDEFQGRIWQKTLKILLQGESARIIIEYLFCHKFVDDHLHRLGICEKFHILAQMAVKSDSRNN